MAQLAKWFPLPEIYSSNPPVSKLICHGLKKMKERPGMAQFKTNKEFMEYNKMTNFYKVK